MRLSSRCATARSRGRRLHRHRVCPVTREVKTNWTVAEPKRRRDANLAARCVRYASCQMSGGSCGNPTSNRAKDSALALSKLIRRRKRALRLTIFPSSTRAFFHDKTTGNEAVQKADRLVFAEPGSSLKLLARQEQIAAHFIEHCRFVSRQLRSLSRPERQRHREGVFANLEDRLCRQIPIGLVDAGDAGSELFNVIEPEEYVRDNRVSGNRYAAAKVVLRSDSARKPSRRHDDDPV